MHVADSARTDFSRYSLQQMVAMLNAADSASIRGAADSWHEVGQYLNSQANALDDVLPDFESKWQGGAATQYEKMVADLSGGVRQLANHAGIMRDLLHDSADALDDAKARMPAAVSIPEVSPSVVALATTPLQMMAPANGQEAALLAVRQQNALAQVQAQQAAMAQAQTAQTQAAQIMTELANHYSSDTVKVPESPAATSNAVHTYSSKAVSGTVHFAAVRGSGGAVTGIGGALAGSGGALTGPAINFSADPVTGLTADGGTTTVTDSPLFGGMVAAGLAAATAASAGRFGGIPAVPAFAQSTTSDGGTDAAATTGSTGAGAATTHPGGTATTHPGGAATTHPGGAAAADVGAAAAGALPRAFGGGSAATAAASPTGFAQLASGSANPTASLGATPVGMSAASTGGAGVPVGAMPMGGAMGAGADGSGRRTPQWLVETEDVWGESSSVSPAVLGEA